jgi:hypothetical protein
MTPTSFDFTITMPGDERFVGAVRLLAAHAAGYAQMTAEAGAALAHHVERAATAAVEAAKANAPIDLHFSGGEGTVNIHIACEAADAAHPPRSSHGEGVSVEWSAHGSRHTCHIRQRIPA